MINLILSVSIYNSVVHIYNLTVFIIYNSKTNNVNKLKKMWGYVHLKKSNKS